VGGVTLLLGELYKNTGTIAGAFLGLPSLIGLILTQEIIPPLLGFGLVFSTAILKLSEQVRHIKGKVLSFFLRGFN
jgi:hypothetical protein